MFNKIKRNKNQVLQDIIDKQNEELIELRDYAHRLKHYKQKEKEMDKTYECYRVLIKELEDCRDEYVRLNQELISTIASYKEEMGKFTKI